MTGDFLAPGRLWWGLVVIALAVAYVASLRWRSRAQVRFTRVDLLERVAPARPRWRRHLIAAVNLLGLAAAVVALARPVERTTERSRSEGRILVLFDVSLSMQATDVDPDRLSAAKQAARDFVDAVDDDVEVGLVSFAGVVRVEVEPTLDRSLLDRRIDDLDLDLSTAIGDALAVGTRVLVDLADSSATGAGGDPGSDDGVAPGAIVLLSDGSTTVGLDTADGAAIAADAGVPVSTITFGTLTGAIVDPVTGDVVPVPVEPGPLRAVAEATGGEAFEARTGDELVDAYDSIRDALGDTLGEEVEVVAELTWRWAAAAFALMAAAWALSLWWLRGMV
ncbi:VWA domain-containing protein [Ilumatobacter sp.]|uniref:VWA domain-containing protein n=1 Tax=Ilumatobacter sp. TaxID=1967498 RepID=UPI003B5212FC